MDEVIGFLVTLLLLLLFTVLGVRILFFCLWLFN